MGSLEEIRNKIYPDRNGLVEYLRLRRKGKRVVFTNGCFDLLHVGHISYLQQARDLGDLLVIGVNSDESVSGYKGPERPLNRVEDRTLVLAALGCVDFVTIFSEPTPSETLALLCPEIHVKGGDYRIEDLPERSVVEGYGGKIRIIPFLEGFSTTSLLHKIRGVR